MSDWAMSDWAEKLGKNLASKMLDRLSFNDGAEAQALAVEALREAERRGFRRGVERMTEALCGKTKELEGGKLIVSMKF